MHRIFFDMTTDLYLNGSSTWLKDGGGTISTFDVTPLLISISNCLIFSTGLKKVRYEHHKMEDGV